MGLEKPRSALGHFPAQLASSVTGQGCEAPHSPASPWPGVDCWHEETLSTLQDSLRAHCFQTYAVCMGQQTLQFCSVYTIPGLGLVTSEKE